MNERSALVGVALLVLLATGIGVGLDPWRAPQPSDARIEYNSTVLRADLQADGDATWTIEYRVELNDPNTTAAFESLRSDVRENRSAFEGQFAARMNRTARAAENATGREMVIRNVSVSTRTEVTDTGVVAYTFEWTNFAVVTGEAIRAGDAVSGIVLDRDSRLLFSWPEGYGVVSLSPDARERRPGIAVWTGPATFAGDEPRLVLATVTPTPTDGATTDRTDRSDGGTTTAPEPGGGIDATLVGLFGIALIGLAAAAWYLRDRGAGSVAPGDGPDGAGGTSAASTDAGTGDGGETGEGNERGESRGQPEELLSNEERVLRLLEEHGGRMKQRQVVSELGWTDAKTSQVVGSLRDEGEIEVFRIGRENVLALPGETDL
jgi:hypothetical protein